MVPNAYLSFVAVVIGVPLAVFANRTLIRLFRQGDRLTAEEQANWTERGP